MVGVTNQGFDLNDRKLENEIAMAAYADPYKRAGPPWLYLRLSQFTGLLNGATSAVANAAKIFSGCVDPCKEDEKVTYRRGQGEWRGQG
jgi:hypothetical protein